MKEIPEKGEDLELLKRFAYTEDYIGYIEYHQRH
jgi:hypothetical protein